MRQLIPHLTLLAVLAISSYPQASPPPSSAGAAQPTSTSAAAVEVKEDDLVRVRAPQPAYPAAATEQRVQGEVRLKLSIDPAGKVTDVAVISGEPVLARAAVDTVRKWRYAPYLRDGKAVAVTTTLPIDFAFSGQVVDQPAPPPLPMVPGTPGISPQPLAPIKVTRGVVKGVLLHRVDPIYPELARRNRIQGQVVLDAVIGTDGHIAHLKPISGPPELVRAAIDAVQQWRFQPYTIQGQPVEVETDVTVNFALH